MLTPDQERVKALLTEAVTVLCKNGLAYKAEFCIDGLIGITLDKSDVFLVKINETFNTQFGSSNEKEINGNDKFSSDLFSGKLPVTTPGDMFGKCENATPIVPDDVQAMAKLPVAQPEESHSDSDKVVEEVQVTPSSHGRSSPRRKRRKRDNSSVEHLTPSKINGDVEVEMDHENGDVYMIKEEPSEDLIDSLLSADNTEENSTDSSLVQPEATKEEGSQPVFPGPGPPAWSPGLAQFPGLAALPPLSSQSPADGAQNAVDPNQRYWFVLGSPPVLTADHQFAYSPKTPSSDSTLPDDRPTPDQKPPRGRRGRPRAIAPASRLDAIFYRNQATAAALQQGQNNNGPDVDGCVCTLCSKRLASKQSLAFHMKVTHQRIYPYKCPYCGKGFSGKTNLRGHLPIHNNIMEFKCGICQKDFRYKSDLKSHMRKFHDRELERKALSGADDSIFVAK